jgi:hypothetical protein
MMNPMGVTHVTTTLRKLAGGGKGFTAEFLVDTGAGDCLAPGEALRKAGIKPQGRGFMNWPTASRSNLNMASPGSRS